MIDRTLPEYQVWKDLRRRCYNPNYKKRHRYGGRGIGVCWRWRYFQHFLADMGYRPGPEYTIERRDNNGDYEPDNCYWATQAEQQRNHSRNRWLTIGGRKIAPATVLKRYPTPS